MLVSAIDSGYPDAIADAIELSVGKPGVTADVLDAVEPIGGRGGVIAVTTKGEVATPFQTMLMYRGVWKNGEITIGIGPNDVELDSMDS